MKNLVPKTSKNNTTVLFGNFDSRRCNQLFNSRNNSIMKMFVRNTFLFLFILFTGALSAQCIDPQPVIIGDFSVCPGETVTYSVKDYTMGNAYVYTLTNGGTILGTQNGDVTIQWDDEPGGPYQLSVVETVDTCSGLGFANILIEGESLLVCNDNLNISMPTSCEITLVPDIILESPNFQDDSYEITVKDAFGNPIPNVITSAYIGQTLEVTIEHLCSGNKCWGNITIEDKLEPEIMCVDDTLTCNEFANFGFPHPELVADNCGNVTYDYTVEYTSVPQDCDASFSNVMEVTWTATDASGNVSDPCVQTIYVERVAISALTYPLNYDGLVGNKAPLSCSGSYPLNNEGYPAPSYTGSPGGALICSSIEWTYSDIVLPICDQACNFSNASYKVIRTFIAVDWCTGEIREEPQIIKVIDTQAPIINTIANITANVNPFDCSAQILLPLATGNDNCTDAGSISYSYESSLGYIVNGILYLESPAKTMGSGIEVTITASDCCENTSQKSFYITITDDTPPVVVADAHEVISLLPNGTATMYATSLDDGSYDNCGPIGLFVKRMDNGSGLQNIDLFPPAGNDNAQFNEVVHFFCDDVGGTPIMVQFQVCDDADMNGIIGSTNDNCNIAMIEVEVQDKYVPVLQCPANMTISCTDFEGIDLDDQAQIDAYFGTAFAAGTCSVELDETISGSNELTCGEGVIVRYFVATTSGGVEDCTQTISVIPFAENLLTCDRIEFDGLNNSTYNWCVVNDNDNDDDDNLPSIDVNGCDGITVADLDIDTEGLCTTVGIQVTIDTFNYSGSTACKKYVVHYEVIDQCVFEENYVDPITGQIDPYHSGNGYFEFYLEYNVVDNDPPVLNCASSPFEAESCDGYAGTISIEANDACTPDNLLLYEWKLDLNANGTVDLPFGGWFTGNAVNGAAIGLSALPVGNHIVLWRVDDGCGNYETCSQNITISDFDKAPTPYCLGGISTAVMNTNGSVEIWASDFDNGSQDDCGGPVDFLMIPVLDAEEIIDNGGNPYLSATASWEFDCSYINNGISQVVEIRIYVIDETGAYDYCTSALLVEDNQADFCEDVVMVSNISGEIKTEEGENMKDATVELMSIQPEYPLYTKSDANGNYSFDANLYHQYEVSAENNLNPLNGVTTLDIVLIQKHILGLEVIESPYKLIAADVNNDCKVSGTDIIQVRKLLLGKYNNNKFPSNDSWRFVNENEEFVVLDVPCGYKEGYEIDNLITANTTSNFIAVKIADLNSSSSPNLVSNSTVSRSDESLEFVIDNIKMVKNKVIRIPVYANNMTDVYGFQFGIKMNDVMINGVEKGALNVGLENVGMVDAEFGDITFSYHDMAGITLDDREILFTILATPLINEDIKNVISITHNQVIAEAYIGEELELLNVEIALREGIEVIDVVGAFNLMQNEPNPFSNQTNIRFELPVSGEATLKIFDLQGKLVYGTSNSFSKGLHYFKISKADIGITGELFYQLEFKGELQTRKMILIE